MRKLNSTKQSSYWWLKALIIVSIIASAYLLITKQYLVLIEIIICIIAGFILYKVIKHKLEHSSKSQQQTKEQSELRIKTEKQTDDSEFDIRKIATKDLIAELTRRGEIR